MTEIHPPRTYASPPAVREIVAIETVVENGLGCSDCGSAELHVLHLENLLTQLLDADDELGDNHVLY